MINKHIYIGDTLYLYFDYNYEFGSFNITKKGSYIDNIKEYIKKIKYKGSKIVVMVGFIIVVTLTLNNGNIKIDDYNPKTIDNNNNVVEGKVEYTLEDLNELTTLEPIKKEEINKDIVINKSISNEKKESKNIKKEETITNTLKQENIKEESNTIEEKVTKENLIKVLHNSGYIEMELEEYVIGVVAAEMPASFNIEALKAQSVIARTYALNITSQGRILTDNESTQSYIDINQMKTKWGSEFDRYYNKIVSAVNSTKDITVKYNGKYIDCVYHSTSNGYTEDSINVWGNNTPYLKSVESTWDKNATTYLRDTTIDLNTFNNKLGTNISSTSEIQILEINNSGRISNIKVGDKNFTGIDFRTILNLRSADFDIELIDNNIKIN